MFRARAVSARGAAGRWVTATTIVPIDAGLGRGRSFGAGWERVRARGAWMGGVRRSAKAGATMSVRFSGHRVLIVGRPGPRGGRARVRVDGRSRVIGFRAPRAGDRRVVAEIAAPRPGVHTLTLTTLGGGPVDLDAIGALEPPNRRLTPR